MSNRTVGFFKGYSDLELYYQRWQIGDSAKLNIIITHGLGEHSDAYKRLIQGLDIEQANIFAWDLRGHGNSEGRWGIVDKFEDYCQDLRIFVGVVQEALKKEGNTAPLFLIGHSMGGLITTRLVIQGGLTGVAGVVLSSPLFAVALAVPMLKEKAARFLSGYIRNLTLYNEIKFTDLTRDRDVIKEYERDTLRHDRISLGLFIELNDTMAWALENASKFTLPLYIQQAGADHVVSAQAAQKFFMRVGSADKDWTLYDGYYHEIYNDMGREHAYQDLKKWLIKRV